MTSLFKGIQALFVDFLFLPLDWLRALELENWWAANTLNWIFIIICACAVWYWIKQLKMYNEKQDDIQDTTAHSLLK